MRLLEVSAMKISPLRVERDTVRLIQEGRGRHAAVATVAAGGARVSAMVYTSLAVIEMPHCVWVVAATS